MKNLFSIVWLTMGQGKLYISSIGEDPKFEIFIKNER